MESKEKKHVMSIIDYALREASVEKAFSQINLKGNNLKLKGKTFDLGKYEKIFVLGSGKAGYRMALSLNKLLGKKIDDGLVIYTEKRKNVGKIKILEGTHPNPSRKSLDSTKKLIQLAGKTTERDLTIYLLSGGTSSLLCYPKVNLAEFVKLNKELLKSRKNIKKVNRIRKKYSLVKGGKLLDYIKGKVLNLVISDVVGDLLEFIGSGPLYTKPRKKRVDDFILLNNKVLLEKAQEKALKLGYKTKIIFPDYEGSPAGLAIHFRKLAQELRTGQCLISGGELASEVRGNGKGGPNQEFVLRCLGVNATLASLDSDGLDGNSGVAGAIIERKIRDPGADKYLAKSNSYEFFRKNGGSIKTGPTGTNLNDLRIMLKN